MRLEIDQNVATIDLLIPDYLTCILLCLLVVLFENFSTVQDELPLNALLEQNGTF